MFLHGVESERARTRHFVFIVTIERVFGLIVWSTPKHKEMNLPDVTQEDGEEDGQGVGAVRLALVGLGDGVQETLDNLTLALTGDGGGSVLLVVEVVETQDGADGSNGSKEPEGKVSLAVVVDVVDGASVEGVVDLGDGDGLAVQEGLLLLLAVGMDGSVAGHCACVVWKRGRVR